MFTPVDQGILWFTLTCLALFSLEAYLYIRSNGWRLEDEINPKPGGPTQSAVNRFGVFSRLYTIIGFTYMGFSGDLVFALIVATAGGFLLTQLTIYLLRKKRNENKTKIPQPTSPQ